MHTTWLKIALAAGALGTFAPGAWSQTGHAHQHGVAKLNVAIDANRLSIELESPLENLVGFERAPRNDKEREALRTMGKQLRDVGNRLTLNPEAGCKPEAVTISSPVIDAALLTESASGETKADSPAKAAAKAGESKGGHAEIEVRYAFRCDNAAALRELQVNFFDPFKRMRRIEARVAGLKKQSSTNLTPTSRKISF